MDTKPKDLEALAAIWEDQATFNRLFREPPKDFGEQSSQTKDFVLELTDELHQLLRTTVWQRHRNRPVMPNVSHTEEKLADAFKYLISLCQVWGVTPDRLIELYWRKSMVCVQRHSEEFVKQLDKYFVIMDLDNVLCDYIKGYSSWLRLNRWHDMTRTQKTLLNQISDRGGFLDASSCGVPPSLWEKWKHDFRTSGAKRYLPTMPHARDFLRWCVAHKWPIVILTSRPIDRYPNMYADTLLWFKDHDLTYDYIWWADNKADRITADLRKHCVFAVDDDAKYILQYQAAKIPAYWLHANGRSRSDMVWPVSSLKDIARHYATLHGEYECQNTTTTDIAPTPTIEDRPQPLESIVAPAD